MLVSVIIATYRRPEKLSEAIDSVLEQTYNNYEIIVLDDNGVGSPHQLASQQVIARKNRGNQIKYIALQNNMGGAAARNAGIKPAEGNYVAFLDDDETWEATKLEDQMAALRHNNFSFACVDTGFYDSSNQKLKIYYPEMTGQIYNDLLQKTITGKRAPKLSTLLVKKEVLIDLDGFDDTLPARQDYELYLRMFKHHELLSVFIPLATKKDDAEERISSNINNKIKASDFVFEKHRDAILENPHSHASHLLRHSRLLYNSGDKRKAYLLYKQACRDLKGMYRFKFKFFLNAFIRRK